MVISMEFYGTVGEACCRQEVLEKMFQAGMTGVRINMSHQSLEESAQWLISIRSAAKKQNKKPEILIDLQGPELRIGKIKEAVFLQRGEMISLEEKIPFPKNLIPYLKEGQQILLDDGKLLLEVNSIDIEQNDNGRMSKIECRVLRGGMLSSRKSIALPGVDIPMPVLTSEDKKNVAGAKAAGVTGVMLPFVRGVGDVLELRQALNENGGEDIRIFSKIENMTGVEKIHEIIPESDMIIIARGDLGNSLPLWELPAIQKKIATVCRKEKVPFMVVTQMLHSMEQSAVPTRAEVTDIYNAVLDGAQALMLTGETAVGKYPAEAMEYLVKTGKEGLKAWQEQ